MARRSSDGQQSLTQPVRFIARMLLFVAIVAAVAAAIFPQILIAFRSNIFINSVIFGVLIIGILHNFGQVSRLWPEIRWINGFRRSDPSFNPVNLPTPRLLAPMAMMLADRRGPVSLSPAGTRAILDSVDSRLEESREISVYLTRLMVFLGLLGTFWGLMLTVTSLGDTIRNLSPTGGDTTAAFGELQKGIQAPLGGMGTAFSSSLFGLTGSLVLGFLHLQASQAQNRFYNKLEEWLSTITRLGGASPIEQEGAPVPQYMGALLEQTAESLDGLQRTLAKQEERRTSAEQTLMQLSQRLQLLADSMQTETKLMMKLAEGQTELKPVIERLARTLEGSGPSGMGDTATQHLRNLDISTRRLLEEATEGRAQFLTELRNELKLVSKTIAALADDRRR